MVDTADREGGYELRHYLRVLWRRKLSVVAPVVVLAILGWLLGSGLSVSYSSRAEVLAKPVETSLSSTGSGTRLEAPVADEVAIISSDEYQAAVEAEVGHLVDVVISQVDPDSNVVSITVSGEQGDVQTDAQTYADTYIELRRAELAQGTNTAIDQLTSRVDDIDAELAQLAPQLADVDAEIATTTDEIALRGLSNQRDELLAQRGALNDRGTEIQQQIDELELTAAVNPTQGIEVLSNATEPRLMSGATPLQYAGAGVALGLVLGVLLAFAREQYDGTIHSVRDAEIATRGVRVLGVVPRQTRGATR